MNREIVIHRSVDEARLTELGVSGWPLWSKDASSFPWSYDATEHCYFLEGEVVVTPEGGEPVSMGEGDLATFPAGLSCHWEIRQAVRKHYMFK